jgi:hypothetical protein
MTARVRPIAAALANVYDFSTVDSIVDIGGGHGQLLISLLTTHPRLRGVVFDLPTVVDGARRAAVMAGVAERLDVIGGSMFERVPPGADVYLMSSILHDWADAEVLTSLRRTRDAMTALSRLLILECFLPQPGDRSAAAQAQQLDDLNMLVRTGGRSRHESELRGLLDKAGLRVSSVRPIGFARSLVEAVRRA